MSEETREETPRITIHNSVICDDVRREDNGKYLLIGVYDGIRVQTFPTNLMLGFWIHFTATAAGTLPLHIRVLGDQGEQFFEVGITLTVRSVEPASIGLGGLPVALQVPTNLNWQFKLGDGEWQTFRTINVARGNVISATRPGIASSTVV